MAIHRWWRSTTLGSTLLIGAGLLLLAQASPRSLARAAHQSHGGRAPAAVGRSGASAIAPFGFEPAARDARNPAAPGVTPALSLTSANSGTQPAACVEPGAALSRPGGVKLVRGPPRDRQDPRRGGSQARRRRRVLSRPLVHRDTTAIEISSSMRAALFRTSWLLTHLQINPSRSPATDSLSLRAPPA